MVAFRPGRRALPGHLFRVPRLQRGVAAIGNHANQRILKKQAPFEQELFAKGYIAKRSSHSRGSAIDLTLLDMSTGKELDMGSPFDLFSPRSHPDCRDVTEEQFANRMLLQHAMVRNGFAPIDCEWWHFALADEPYPDTYFEFPVCSGVLRR